MGFFERVRQAKEAEQIRQQLDYNNQNRLRQIEPQLRRNVQNWSEQAIHNSIAKVRSKGNAKLQQLQSNFNAHEQLVDKELLRICEEVILSGFEYAFYERGVNHGAISKAYSDIDYLFSRIGITEEEIVIEFRAAMYELYYLGNGFGEDNHLQNHIIMRK